MFLETKIMKVNFVLQEIFLDYLGRLSSSFVFLINNPPPFDNCDQGSREKSSSSTQGYVMLLSKHFVRMKMITSQHSRIDISMTLVVEYFLLRLLNQGNKFQSWYSLFNSIFEPFYFSCINGPIFCLLSISKNIPSNLVIFKPKLILYTKN